MSIVRGFGFGAVRAELQCAGAALVLAVIVGCSSTSESDDVGTGGGLVTASSGGAGPLAGEGEGAASSVGGASAAGGDGEGAAGGGVECSYTPTPGAIDFRTADCGGPSADASERLSCALAMAAANPTFDPPADPSGYGPTQTQGVVRIALDPRDPPYMGENAIELVTTVDGNNTFVAMPSNTRLEIDSGIRLIYGDDSVNGQLFHWDSVHDVTITRGDPCHDRGRFVVDLRSQVAQDAKARFVALHDVSRFLLEHMHTIAQYHPDSGPGGGNGSGAPTILFHAASNGQPPREGLYRHHSNQGSAAGWGANQIASLSSSHIEDIWTDGGNAIRFETSTGFIGSRQVTVEHVYAQNGNAAVAFTPHDASSDEIHVTDVRAKSMYLGVGAFGQGPAAGIGLFTATTVEDACVVAGNQAQGDEDPAQSAAAVLIKTAEGADVSVTAAYAAGNFTSNNVGAGTDPACSASTVGEGWPDWTMPEF